MPSRTLSLHGFTVEVARQQPVAVVTPAEVSRVVGALIRLSGRSSLSPDDSELSYAWSFAEVPIGSTVPGLISVEDDGGVVTFVPDMTGLYVVQLIVSTPYRDSDPVTAAVSVTSVQVPTLLRTTPDGRVMFDVVSSFWTLVERNAVFSTLWSGYMQLVANDLLALFQIDSGKSIATMQSLVQRRWLDYSPALELDSARCTGVFGYHQSGTGAFTSSGTAASTGVIITDQEIVLVDGAPTLDAVGTVLTVYTSAGSPGNTGTYTISRLNSDASGYVVSVSAPFPDAAVEVLHAAGTLVTASGSREVYDSVGGTNFVTLDVEEGDVLRLEAGSDAGYYVVEAVGVAGGLANNRTLRLDRAPTQTLAGRAYTVFNRVRVSARKLAAAATNVVYVPVSEADFALYTPRTLSGTGAVAGQYELVVEERHVFAAMVGETIVVTSGSASGRNFTITGLNAAGTGYRVGAALGGTRFPYDVAYSLSSSASVADRLLILEDEAYAIVAAARVAGVPIADGGRGPLWVITLDEASVPAGREGMHWRVGGTMTTDEHADVAALGVTHGDLLVLEVVRADRPFVGALPCYVLGARGNKLAFDFGTGDPVPGTNGALSDEEVLRLADGLKIPRVYEDDSGVVQVTDLAEEVRAFVLSTSFKSRYGNLPLTSTTVIDLDGAFSVTLRVRKIVRNCRVPVDATLVSVPALFEYIDTPEYGVQDGVPVLVGEYGDVVPIDRVPLELLENRDYVLSSEAGTVGTNLETTAGSAVLRVPSGALIDRDVRVGDYVELTSGVDRDVYFVRAVLDDERLQAVTDDGRAPTATAVGISYILRRRTTGNLLRFVDGMFTPSVPAPDRFWAQLSLHDNSGTIEDNFGVMVGVTKEQLDEYGSSQVSYRGVVQGLMYAWTSGPTVRNAAIGMHLLTGLPVTEVRGRIVQVDEAYDTVTGRGRVLVEDLDREGGGTGIVRIYYYAIDDSSGLSDFQGLATNPTTGIPYAVLDVVEAFAPLSRGIVVSDYLTDPLWWDTGDDRAVAELQKFHTWQVLMDASQVDSRDLALVSAFAMGIRPVYTEPRVTLVLYLYDEVTVTDDLVTTLTLHLADDPVLSLEATSQLDSYNGSSLANRVVDHGSLATRTLFEGRDLVTTAGSGVVTSARGGFTSTLLTPPLAHAPLEPVGTLAGINERFTGNTVFRGSPLVRVGDVLFIREGNNRGRYLVTVVTSATQLTVAELADWPPGSRPVAEMEAGTAQVFQIQRVDSAEIRAGEVDVIDYPAGDPTTLLQDLVGSMRWDGVAVGDVLVIEDGALGAFEVLQVGWWDAGDLVDRDTRVIVRGIVPDGTWAYRILREALRTNPLLEITDLVLSTGSSTVSSALVGDFVGVVLRKGDQLEVLTGTYAGASFTILDWVADTLFLDFVAAGNETGVDARVVRPSLFEAGEVDADWALEEMCAFDAPTFTVVHPKVLVVAVADLDLASDTTDPDPANWFSTATSATDLAAAGVVAGDYLEVANAALNSGSRTVASVATVEVTIEGLWRGDEDPVAGEFYTDDDAWSVLDDTATLAGTLNLEYGPMVSTDSPYAANVTFTTTSAAVTGAGTNFLTLLEVGDVVRFPGDGDLDWARISAIATDTALTLDRLYTGAGGVGGMQRGVPGGMVQAGDVLEVDTVGDFVISKARGAVLTLTRDTGVGAPTNHTGRVTRAT